MRSTPERAQQCQKVFSPIGGLARTGTESALPDTECDRKDVQHTRHNHEGGVSGVGTQQEVLGRAGKESPSAAKPNDQKSKNVASCWDPWSQV